MARYCADFTPSSSDWTSPGGSWDAMASGSFDCARAYVIVDASEFEALQAGQQPNAFTADEVASLKYMAANPSPFNLSMSEGTLVAGAVAATWAVAWAVRQLVRALNTDGEKE